MEIEKMPIPEVGKIYPFWDDGKSSLSRHYVAKVLRVVSYEEANNIRFPACLDEYDYTPTTIRYNDKTPDDYFMEKTLMVIWEEECESHKDSNGDSWLYYPETDYFIECSIPDYDEDTIWFGRTKYGGWFSFDIQSSWQSGYLDVTYEKFKGIMNDYRKFDGYEEYYNELMKVWRANYNGN